MKTKAILFILLISLGLACSKVPVTGRKQVNLLPESSLVSMGLTSYNEFLATHKTSTNTAEVNRLRMIGSRLAEAVTRYMRNNNMADRIENYKWEFNLIEDKQVNAWCMPGGKVVFYTGILPICKDDNGIAVVMGHEIAHAVARHGNERMSQALLVEAGGLALDAALAQQPQQTRNMFFTAYGVGSAVGVMLPFSRLHESEADRLGLIFMAMAGYNPNTAVDFWQRMAAQKKGSSTPEFLSTHPADASRIRDIKKHMPEAMTYYRKP